MKVTETVSRRIEARFNLGNGRPAAVILESRNGREQVRLQLGSLFHDMTRDELRDLQQALGQALESIE